MTRTAMRSTARPLLLAATLVIGGFAAPGFVSASEADLDIIREQCTIQLKMPDAACDCLRKRAAELGDNQQAFVAATVLEDKARMTKLRSSMSVEEMTRAATFMATAPAHCARQ